MLLERCLMPGRFFCDAAEPTRAGVLLSDDDGDPNA
jgi:hypothetical protein